MRSLIWKQWRESRLLLTILTGWMLATVAYTILYELGHGYRAVVGAFSTSTMLYTLVAAIVLAVRTSRGEKSDGTHSFTESLPLSIRRVASVRITAAMLTLAIPILLSACILAAALCTGIVEQSEPRDAAYSARLLQRPTASLMTSLEQLSSVTAIAILGGVELLLVISLCGCWLHSRAQVGMLGSVMALGSIIGAGAFWYGTPSSTLQLAYGIVLPQSLIIHWSYGEETGGYTDHQLVEHRWLSMGLAMLVLAMLAMVFIYRYGSRSGESPTAKRRWFRFAMPSIASRLPMRLPNRLLALTWLELRQSVPLAAFGLAFAVLLAVSSVLVESGYANDLGTSLRMELPHATFIVGLLWAAVVGSGLFSRDLEPNSGNFWRSRPISPTMWFWCKFVIGLLAVIVVLDGATAFISWNAPRDSMTTGMSWAYVGCFPVIHAMMYSLSVCVTCSFRKPVVGGILAVVIYFAATALITAFPATINLEPITIYNSLLATERAGVIDFSQHGYPFVFGILTAMSCLFAITASRFAKPLESTFNWPERLPSSRHSAQTVT